MYLISKPDVKNIHFTLDIVMWYLKQMLITTVVIHSMFIHMLDYYKCAANECKSLEFYKSE